jgi:hypothetical protein
MDRARQRVSSREKAAARIQKEETKTGGRPAGIRRSSSMKACFGGVVTGEGLVWFLDL